VNSLIICEIINGTAFVNSDDEAVVELSSDLNKKIFYGTSGKKRSSVKIIKSDPFPEIQVKELILLIYKNKSLLELIIFKHY